MIRQNKSSNVFSINTLENSNFDCDYDIQHTQNNIINSSSGNNKISNSEEVKCCGNKDHNEGRRIIFNNNKSNSQMRKILRKKEEGNIYDNLIHKQQRLVKKHDDNCDINAILLIIKSLLSISIFNLSSFYCHLISSYSRKNSDKKNIVFSRLVIIVKFLRKNNKYQSLIKVLLTAFIVLHLNESFCNLVVSAAANVTIDKTRATIIVKNFSSNNNVYNNINNNNNINEPPLDSINLNLVNEFEEFNNDEGYSHYTHTWAVHIPNGDEDGIADAVAREHGFINRGKIFDDHYHFEHKSIQKRSIDPAHHHQKRLHEDERVQWAQQQRAKSRQKRDFIRMKSPRTLQLTPLSFYWNDPKWPQMWYLNRGNSLDMNVIPAWKEGITGKGIVVTILDDGLESDHPDLEHNYDPKASYDVNSHDEDPMPHYDMTDSNRHGTRCAGEVAATANNSLCAVGIAFGARVGGVRMLDGDVTDAVEARSLSLNPQHIDIYSASWGPDDDGKTVDGPGDLASRAFIEGVTKGRNGKGSIFIWASGNGGREQDNCNCDGYTNSIWTLSISSATEEGHVPWYSEKCSSTLATTYSSGGQQEKQVVTTDLHHSCTISHTGTSASAPLAAGIAALVLEANRNLTWRDLQHIVVRTGKPGNLKDPTWARNGVGRLVSHSFGYGLMDAAAMVKLARTWKTVPEQQKCEINAPHIDKPIPSKGYISLQLTVKHCMGVNFLEHVQAKITLTSQRRGDIQIYLTSPAGTKVTLLTTRAHDVSRSGFNHWPFMSVHTWGETPRGNWQLEIRNEGKFMAQITQWDLIFYGTETPPQPDDPIQITPGRFGGYGGEIEHNDLNFDSEISGQWRNSHQVSESHADVQRTANDQTNAACVKFSPDNTCIDCDRTTFLFNGRCYLKCPSGTYMIPERIDLNNDNDNDSGRTIKSFSLNIGYGGGDAGKIGNDIRYKSGRLREKLKQCDNCDTRCFECFGPSQSECVSCHPGYKLRKVSSKEFYCYSFKERSFRNGNGYLYDGPKATEDNINNDNFGISGNAFLFGIIILPSIALCSLVVIVTLYKKSYSNHPSPNSKYGKNYIYDLVEFDVPNEEAHILLCENDNDKSESSPGDLYERTEWNLEDDEEKGDSFAIKNSENTGFDSGNFERTLNDNSTVEDS